MSNDEQPIPAHGTHPTCSCFECVMARKKNRCHGAGEIPERVISLANFQLCKDCKGHGWLEIFKITLVCRTCNGKGRVYRRGPYRLMDGGWSDGTIRRYRVASLDFSVKNPGRWHVMAQHQGGRYTGKFQVFAGMRFVKVFPTLGAALDYVYSDPSDG